MLVRDVDGRTKFNRNSEVDIPNDVIEADMSANQVRRVQPFQHSDHHHQYPRPLAVPVSHAHCKTTGRNYKLVEVHGIIDRLAASSDLRCHAASLRS